MFVAREKTDEELQRLEDTYIYSSILEQTRNVAKSLEPLGKSRALCNRASLISPDTVRKKK